MEDYIGLFVYVVFVILVTAFTAAAHYKMRKQEEERQRSFEEKLRRSKESKAWDKAGYR